MKKLNIYLILALCFFCSVAFAQKPSLKVGDNPVTMDTSAVFDAESTTKGFLPPRMTTAQRDAIASPAKGLVLYNTTLDCLQVNKGSAVSPVWECIGASASASLIIDCVASRFALSSPAQDPLCTGLFIGTTGYQVKFLLINNSFTAVSALDLSTAVALTGAGAAGLTVTAGQNTNVSVGGGSSTTITYNLSGAPTTAGAITATFNRLSLSCAINNTVANPATWAGNGLNGSSVANANFSCNAIKNAFPASADGVYWIDPDGLCSGFAAMQAQCDMTTDGGGWTLIDNYIYNQAIAPVGASRSTLPITIGSFGANEYNNPISWGMSNAALVLLLTKSTALIKQQGISGSPAYAYSDVYRVDLTAGTNISKFANATLLTSPTLTRIATNLNPLPSYLTLKANRMFEGSSGSPCNSNQYVTAKQSASSCVNTNSGMWSGGHFENNSNNCAGCNPNGPGLGGSWIFFGGSPNPLSLMVYVK